MILYTDTKIKIKYEIICFVTFDCASFDHSAGVISKTQDTLHHSILNKRGKPLSKMPRQFMSFHH